MSKSSLSPAIHNISFLGLTGVIFALIAAAMVLYLEAYVTTSWVVSADVNSAKFNGLWQTCTYTDAAFASQAWFLAVQLLLTFGLLGIVVCFILATLYMSANRASKNLTLIGLVFASFITAGLIFIGLVIFGSLKPDDSGSISWSFGVTIGAAILLLLAGLLTALQIRRSNVQVC